MKTYNDFKKGLGIGPGGINCACCIDWSAKGRKKYYRKRQRTIQKLELRRELND